MKLCTKCMFCAQQDYGYSNWTPMGTTLRCVKGLNKPLDVGARSEDQV